MKRALKIEAFSGASGDMFLGALAGLLDAYDELKDLPKLLNFEEEAEIQTKDLSVSGIVCKHVKVVELKHQHHHRHLTDIVKFIDNSQLTKNAKNIAKEIFNIIGAAESKVHGIPLEKIHFHEVGAVDSIIDICGAAYLLDKLEISESYLTNLVTGKGFVKTAHGNLPVPCPATKLIIEDIPYSLGSEDGEKLTPTGAAIIKYLSPFVKVPSMKDIKTAYGPGEKEFTNPNLLRLSISEIDDNSNDIIVIETNIDDMNSEYLGIEFQEKLLKTGAIDFWFTQIIMKKGRPGLKLSVLCNQNKFKEVVQFIFKFTSTIGLRYYNVNRIELKRKTDELETEYGRFRIKTSTLSDGTEKNKLESQELLKTSFEKGINQSILNQKIIGKYEKDN